MPRTTPPVRASAQDVKHPAGGFELNVMTPQQRESLSIIGTIKGFVHGWKQVQVVDPQDCRGCGLCVTACPEKAITLTRSTTHMT
jgi:4Fe-4S ferredoxin